MRRADMALVGGLLAIVGAGAVFGVSPRLRERAWLGREIERLEVELARPTGGPEVVSRLEEDLDQLRRFGEGRMTPIPRDADMAGLMSALSAALAKEGIDRRDIVTRDARRMEGAWALPVSMSMESPFRRVYSALTGIESLPRLVRIERLKISRPRPDGRGSIDRSGVIRAEVAISAFFNAAAPAQVADGEAKP